MNKEPLKFSKETPVEIPEFKHFEIPGAGQLRIGAKPNHLCGSAAGFHLSVSWTAHKFTGGVLGIDEAKRLANHILSECEKVESTEAKLRERLWANMLKEQES